ncbi:hypothetical protein [Sphingomonas sp.]|uniref:hypothetical protein n=1 Tax=Sphingomonas sp. TaxID=28214 RepID=UPI001EC6FB5C|nr:hypothetical protein [Sphingomonas sp.]MBX3592911.1 hypothetical protein [Sphingomonas sp.]
MRYVLAVAAPILASALPAAAQDRPPCREVGDVSAIRIDPDAAAKLREIGLGRAEIFQRMRETSIPETMGCWAMPVGNFDSQLVSVGMSQWNYGTGSLQPLLHAWRDGFHSRRRFRRALRELAPEYGRLFFSRDCLDTPVRDRCRAGILAAHGQDGKLNPIARGELTGIFESDAMLQVQADAYVALLLEVRGELLRLWPDTPITMRKVRWAIDTRVQQKTLPGDEDVARLRRKLAALPSGERAARLKAMLAWYQGLSEAVDQDGVSRDYAWNVAQWTCMIDAGRIDDEQFELLHLTFLRSRTATGNMGRWQALTFSRRAKIILGVGSVSGVRDGSCLEAQQPPP